MEGEIFVVDNNSTDGSRELLSDKFPKVNFIWNTENEGFARANNKALQKASGDYILFLNPDTIVPEDCFEKCISFIQANNNAIACGIKMIDGSGKFLKESKRAFPSPVISLYKLTGITRLFPKSKVFSKYHLGFLNENENHEVDVLAGAFMMMPKKISDAIGGFDESFFMYGEDIDLSYRIQEGGYKNFYFAESSIIHFKGESTKKASFNYLKLFYTAMSVFVRKHYAGTKVGIFNSLIHLAIFLRAMLSAIARFIKWIGVSVIDAGIILMSFWFVKFFWSSFIKREVNYSPYIFIVAFPAFTFLFLMASYFSGLYDNGYRQTRLNKSTFTAVLILLATYSLLPESLRFSRGILLFGSIMAFLFMSITRWLFLKWNIIEKENSDVEINQTVIIGTENDFNEVSALLQQAGLQERVLGRIEPGEISVPKTIGSFSNLKSILKTYPVKEIIFCEGTLSFKKIIETLPQLPKRIRRKFYASGSLLLIGSAGKNVAGTYISKEPVMRLNHPIIRRNKMLGDMLISLFFLITFPVHFIIKSKPLSFFKNVLNVLFLKRTWIGYALCEKDLLSLKPGILTTTGLPASLNTLPDESLHATDIVYAENFHILNDVKIVWLNYKLLSL